MSIFEDLVKFETAGKFLDEIELCGRPPNNQPKEGESESNGKPLISSLIFQHIFDSQSTNIDTISCIVCHFINYIQSNFQQSTGEKDTTFDVNDDLKKDDKEAGSKKGKAAGKNASKGCATNKWNPLKDFLDMMIDDIIKNKVLKDSAQWFSYKKQITS